MIENNISTRLAHAQGRRDEEPNILLADDLVMLKDTKGISQIAQIASTGKRQAQGDAIKVLYEIGVRDPKLLLPHIQLLIDLLQSKNNRVVWGTLTALAAIVDIAPDSVTKHLLAILRAADEGSVIAKDQAMQILITMLTKPDFARIAVDHIFSRLETSAVNQLPMYAERVYLALDVRDHSQFHQILSGRLADNIPLSKRRRIETIIAKLS